MRGDKFNGGCEHRRVHVQVSDVVATVAIIPRNTPVAVYTLRPTSNEVTVVEATVKFLFDVLVAIVPARGVSRGVSFPPIMMPHPSVK